VLIINQESGSDVDSSNEDVEEVDSSNEDVEEGDNSKKVCTVLVEVFLL
jgi:hypothetical protein